MPLTDVDLKFDDQILHAITLVIDHRFTAAAAVVAQLPGVDRKHVSCVLVELERGHTHNAITALELIKNLYCPARPRLRLVVDRDGGKFLA